MKKIWYAAGILGLITLLCIFTTYKVSSICSDTVAVLRQAETCCVRGDYQGVENTVCLAEDLWKKHEGFLGMALRHTETDDVSVMFSTLVEAAAQELPSDIMMRNRELIAMIKELSHMEIPFHYNVL